jgi:hypothetical protein
MTLKARYDDWLKHTNEKLAFSLRKAVLGQPPRHYKSAFYHAGDSSERLVLSDLMSLSDGIFGQRINQLNPARSSFKYRLSRASEVRCMKKVA